MVQRALDNLMWEGQVWLSASSEYTCTPIKNCDERGRIAERGTHEELLEKAVNIPAVPLLNKHRIQGPEC